jgi:hypothetical protein
MGDASHRSDIKKAGVRRCRNVPFRPLCRAYETEQEPASISYAVRRIFEAEQEFEDGPLSHHPTRIHEQPHGYLKNMIEAIANSKLNRMQRELELRGTRYDRANDSWIARNSQPSEHSR